jgi:hypothetical protein
VTSGRLANRNAFLVESRWRETAINESRRSSRRMRIESCLARLALS